MTVVFSSDDLLFARLHPLIKIFSIKDASQCEMQDPLVPIPGQPV